METEQSGPGEEEEELLSGRGTGPLPVLGLEAQPMSVGYMGTSGRPCGNRPLSEARTFSADNPGPK